MRKQLPQAGSDQKNEKMMHIKGVIGAVPMTPFYMGSDMNKQSGSLMVEGLDPVCILREPVICAIGG